MAQRDTGRLARLRARLGRAYRWARTRLPPGLRSVAGLVLILGGLFGFLPILGFWMIPLGLSLIWLDGAGLIRRLRGASRRKGHGDRSGKDGA